MEQGNIVGPPTAATGAPSGDQPSFLEQRRELESKLALAKRDIRVHTKELQDAERAGKQMDETLQHLQYIVSAQSQEVGQQKLEARVVHETDAFGPTETSEDPKVALTEYREISGELQRCFRNALDKKLMDQAFIEKLKGETIGSKADHVHIHKRMRVCMHIICMRTFECRRDDRLEGGVLPREMAGRVCRLEDLRPA